MLAKLRRRAEEEQGFTLIELLVVILITGTRGYVEQFLPDVADGSGSLGSPYAVTPQYTDPGGRAQNSSKFGGGCIDYGAIGGSACEFGNPTGPGHDYPANGCKVTGDSFVDNNFVGANTVCLTDAQLRDELSTMIAQTGIVGTQPGYTPVVTLLLPAGVETCLDATGKLCSVNGSLTPPPSAISTNDAGGGLPPGTYQVKTTYLTSSGESLPSASQTVTTTGTISSLTITSPPPTDGVTGWYAYVEGPGQKRFFRVQHLATPIGIPVTVGSLPSGPEPPHPPFFWSYHSRVDVGGAEVAYVVQPWTAFTSCDEPDAPPLVKAPTPQQLAINVGLRLVSPLSQTGSIPSPSATAHRTRTCSSGSSTTRVRSSLTRTRTSGAPRVCC